ncbi:MAG TPA: dipeptide/oligopeptide/nickel ABC transporter ATP-binding protein [Nitrospiraceae bacterium]|nr:MAG: dipeptide/oligopeptide/nickel ABC transporter ATP-binding protein [Nitrospirae bacterium GWA2_46_11]OGW23414.1 MAG: dipeptide/oligopeptide/nickel ABC transporter ATP-binding protein [Nitrospirae bacterium GWB2_47_37]HAK89838.1 dipeptide/oligopeptide/nickel ABC transporter ATP-binding protein [Nitrospiraceae bacterium]HCZ10977.1 dipeptide/oligopeptide/nickel ABC transporter ATP-binding protein [Nitrospiraceae bacterium]
MSSALLDIKNLSVSFKTDKGFLRVVSGLSFDIKKSEVFGLVGESGCGKSLTALSIMRILPNNAFAEGEIFFNDKNLLTLGESEMRVIRGKDISMIFQEPMTSLNPVLTVGYQIAEALTAHFDISKKEAMNRATVLLRDVKIPSPELRIKDYPHQMSGGMRQRVMIAMAIACNPQLLIADEPTTALDVTIQAQILELLHGLRKERDMSVLLITHDLSIISEQADRVAIMYAGRIMELADVDELFINPLHPYTKGLLESLPVAKGAALKPITGFVPTPDQFPDGCKFSDRCNMASDICMGREPDLREISKNHFVRCVKV